MTHEISRENYFSIKHNYLTFKTLLILLRIINSSLIVFGVVFVIVFSTNKGLMQEMGEMYNTVSNIYRYLLLAFLIFWLVDKIIVVLYVKKLRKLKRRLEIIDEI